MALAAALHTPVPVSLCASRVLLVTSMLLLGAGRARTEPALLDVDGWLRMPGVRLVAVEFYAEWCAPCKAAVPRWKRLVDQYRDRGLRLVVVTVQSEGKCAPYAWRPDATVCDRDGAIARSWRAETLPQAFVWSWQGRLLAAHAGFDEVERVVERTLRDTPRVLVQAADPRLRALVRAELLHAGKIDVTADAEELAELRRLRREHQGLAYAEGSCPRPGEELPPNAVLKATQARGAIDLEVLSLEKGCLMASATEPVGRRGAGPAVIGAVAKLMAQLVGLREGPAPPGPAATPAAPATPARVPALAEGRLCAEGDVLDCDLECKAGHLGSCERLGRIYWSGAGVVRDPSRAADLLQRACGGGHASACMRLGELFQASGSPHKSTPWFQRACDGGEGAACVELAYVHDPGLDGRSERAAELYRRACRLGSAEGCRMAALGYRKDSSAGAVETLAQLEPACDRGDARSCEALLALYARGAGDPAARLPQLEGHCAAGKLGLCTALGVLHRDRLEPERALALFRQACAAGHAEACRHLSGMSRRGPAARADQQLVRSALERSCQRRDATACHELGLVFERSDWALAAASHRRACDGGLGAGCASLADLYLAGRGVDRDGRAAERLLERACKVGHRPACGRLPPGVMVQRRISVETLSGGIE